MKVKPVKRASVRAPLPTALEAAADPTLLSVAPPRASRGIGVVLGAGLLGSLLGQTSGCAKESEKPPVATLDADHAADDAKAAERAEAARQAVATLVAPILQKAMDEDGRGAFGCIAVDPPTILSENDALNLIEQEFAKAGIKLRDCYELTGFTQTRTDWKAAPEPKKVEKRGGRDESEIYFDGDGDPARPQKAIPGKWVFDFATEDGALLVEYLSTRDHKELEDNEPNSWCSVTSYDFPHRVARFREELATRTNGAPVTVALFFDPLARTGDFDAKTRKRIPRQGSALAALSEEERDKLSWEQREALKKKDALNKLREQIRFFLDWAKKEGKLPAP